MAPSARAKRILKHATPSRDRQFACKPEYPEGKSCLWWCRTARPHARGKIGVYAEEDVISVVFVREATINIFN